MAVPTLAHQRDTSILGHHQFQHRLLQVWPVIFGIAVGDGNSLGVCLRHIGPCEGKTGGVQTGERLRNPFLLAYGQRNFAEQRVTTVGEGLVETPTELAAVDMLRNSRKRRQLRAVPHAQ